MRLTLIRTADASSQLIWTTHHVLIDGWCVPLVLSEVLSHYEAATGGPAPVLTKSRPFRDYITWLKTRDGVSAGNYWRRRLAGFSSPTPLPPVERRSIRHPEGSAVSERELLFSAALTADLVRLARSERLTLNSLVQAAWGILLGRQAGRRDVVLGTAVSGRPADLEGVRDAMIGMFINTLPRSAWPGERAPRLACSGCTRVQDQLDRAARVHDFTPLVEVQASSDVPRGKALFESIVVFENFPIDEALEGEGGEPGRPRRGGHASSGPTTRSRSPPSPVIASLLRAGYDPRKVRRRHGRKTGWDTWNTCSRA